MRLLSLNIRGFGGDSKVRLLRELIQKEEIDFLAIQESLVTGDASGLVKLLWNHPDYCFSFVPSVGKSGGLICMWRKEIFEATDSFAGAGYLAVVGKWKGYSETITFINVYAPQDKVSKRTLWDELVRIRFSSTTACYFLGDFNAVRHEGDEKVASLIKVRRTTLTTLLAE